MKALSLIQYVCNIVYWLVQVPSLFEEAPLSGAPSLPTKALLTAFGRWCPCVGPTPFYAMSALSGTTLQSGQYWKLFTSNYLHGGVSHLYGNMAALRQYGLSLEQSVGTLRFLVVYFVSGIFGSALSAFHLKATHVGLGASGAIYGVIMASTILTGTVYDNNHATDQSVAWLFCAGHLGTEAVLALAGLTHTEYDELMQLVALAAMSFFLLRNCKSDGLLWALRKQLMLTAFTIFFEDQVDHWAHLGGMVAGLLLAASGFVGQVPRLDALLLLTTSATTVATFAVFCAMCWRAYTEDTFEERMLPNFDLLDPLESFFKWIDLDEALGYGRGGHPSSWVRLPRQ